MNSEISGIDNRPSYIYGYRIKCCIPSCSAKRQDNLHLRFFRLPPRENAQLFSKWIKACQLENEHIKVKHMYVCEQHFEANLKTAKRLKKGSVPTLKLTESENRSTTDETCPQECKNLIQMYKSEVLKLANIIAEKDKKIEMLKKNGQKALKLKMEDLKMQAWKVVEQQIRSGDTTT